jgi:hypothetical protein
MMPIDGPVSRPLLRLPGVLHVGSLNAARARALAASSSRFFGGAFVSRELKRALEILETSSTASWKAVSFAFDGFVKPLTFLTNCNAAAWISSCVTGGSKLKRVLMFLHIMLTSHKSEVR